MDPLEQKRQEVESEIFEILSQIAHQIEHARLKLLLAHRSAIRTTQELVGPLNGKSTGKSAAALTSWTADLPAVPGRYPNRDGMTRGDAIVEILRPVSGGMHTKHIVEKLKEYNFEVSTHSCVGIMKGDVQKRFKNLGHSHYDLADFMRSGNPHEYAPRPAFQRIKGLRGLTLRRAVMLVIDGLDDQPFSQPEIYSKLIELYPEGKDSILKESVAVTLKNLWKDKTLEEVYEGRGRYPKQYKKAKAKAESETGTRQELRAV